MSTTVLAHDYLTQHGGAERVALSMTRAFPSAPMLTSFYDPSQTFAGFEDVDVRPAAVNRISVLRDDPRRALPLLPRVWSSMTAPASDVLLCSSSGWSHGLRTEARKIVYCHNPPRWLYQQHDYTMDMGTARKRVLRRLRPRLTRWDQAAAGSVDLYLANSSSVARRIELAYGVEAQVIHPPVTIDVTGEQEAPAAVPAEFMLVVGRPRGYKNVAATCAAFARLPDVNLVVVGMERDPSWTPNVYAVPHASEAELRYLYAQATAMVAMAYEDFGLTPVEAAAFGTPTIALAAGGYLDTVEPGTSGRFVAEPTSAAIEAGVRDELREPTDPGTTKKRAGEFSEERFHQQLRDIVDGC